ncbi:MAG: alpha/beta hydrolase family protein [Anaerolineae bacterium]
MAQSWYPMTYRTVPALPPVARANRLHVQNQALADQAPRQELLAKLAECGRVAGTEPEAARSMWEEWTRAKRAAVAATLGQTPALRVSSADLQLPVRSEVVGSIRRYSMALAGEDGVPRPEFEALELAGGALARPEAAILVLPELELTAGVGRRASLEKWAPFREAGAAVVLPELPVLQRAYAASCKAMLVSGTTFLAQLLAEADALVNWLHEEKGYATVLVAGEGGGALAALLAAVLLPNVQGCIVAEPPADPLWPLQTMLVLPDARTTMDASVLAALVPPRGLLALDGAGGLIQEAAAHAATLFLLAGEASAVDVVAAPARTDGPAVEAWIRAVADVPAEATKRAAVLGPQTQFAAVTKALAAPSLRERYLTIIGKMPQPSPLHAWTEPIENPDWHMERVFFHSEPDVVVPAVFVKPAGAQGKLPVVLALPGSSSTSIDVALPWGVPLLQRGMAIFAVDAKASRHAKRAAAYTPETVERGGTALGEMAYDLIRALDYLETRDDVDMERIGAFGISQGGTWTWMLAAADDRVKVSAPVVGVGSYRTIISCIRDETIDSSFGSCLDSHSLYYYPPGLLQVGDQADFLALIAPRPLLVLGMSRDNCFPKSGVIETSEALKQVYAEMGAADRFDYYIGEGPHSYPTELQERVWDWMERWL